MKDIDKDYLIGWLCATIMTIIIVFGILVSVKMHLDAEIKIKQIEVYKDIPEQVLEEDK